uniref:Secreted protein n=1 Tax=Octopus bimaculoides TaxID=37653 RepID=A0A0L8HV22_OCTBM
MFVCLCVCLQISVHVCSEIFVYAKHVPVFLPSNCSCSLTTQSFKLSTFHSLSSLISLHIVWLFSQTPTLVLDGFFCQTEYEIFLREIFVASLL